MAKIISGKTGDLNSYLGAFKAAGGVIIPVLTTPPAEWPAPPAEWSEDEKKGLSIYYTDGTTLALHAWDGTAFKPVSGSSFENAETLAGITPEQIAEWNEAYQRRLNIADDVSALPALDAADPIPSFALVKTGSVVRFMYVGIGGAWAKVFDGVAQLSYVTPQTTGELAAAINISNSLNASGVETLTFSFKPGYSIPTTAKQAEWDGKPDALDVQAAIDDAFATFVGAAPESLNTVYDLAAAFQNNPEIINNLLVQVGLKASTEDLNSAVSTLNLAIAACAKKAITTTTGTAVSYIEDTIYGTFDVPVSGNITESLTGAVNGAVVLLYHQSGTEPAYPPTWHKVDGSKTYSTTKVNMIYAQHIAGRIEYLIKQEL